MLCWAEGISQIGRKFHSNLVAGFSVNLKAWLCLRITNAAKMSSHNTVILYIGIMKV